MTKRFTGFLIYTAIILFLWFFKTSQNVPQSQILTPTPQVSEKEGGTVVRVVDGDTIDVQIQNQKERVRLIGIDAPETVDPKKPVQCFGEESSQKAKEILTGKQVRLQSDPTQADKDEYGRSLRYVFLSDGTLFNKTMIAEGYAKEYTFKGIAYQHQLEFKTAEKSAREQNLGLWNPLVCPSGV